MLYVHLTHPEEQPSNLITNVSIFFLSGHCKVSFSLFFLFPYILLETKIANFRAYCCISLNLNFSQAKKTLNSSQSFASHLINQVERD